MRGPPATQCLPSVPLPGPLNATGVDTRVSLSPGAPAPSSPFRLRGDPHSKDHPQLRGPPSGSVAPASGSRAHRPPPHPPLPSGPHAVSTLATETSCVSASACGPSLTSGCAGRARPSGAPGPEPQASDTDATPGGRCLRAARLRVPSGCSARSASGPPAGLVASECSFSFAFL